MSPETIGTETRFGSSDPALLEAFESLVRRLTPELLAYFGRRVNPAEDAADCLGETLLVLWRRRDSLPATPEERRAWADGIANHILKNHRRGRARRMALTERLRDELRTSERRRLSASPPATCHRCVREP